MSLDFDDRQRAMLHEMHVHVWWPDTVVAPLTATPLSAAPLSAAPLSAGKAPATSAASFARTGNPPILPARTPAAAVQARTPAVVAARAYAKADSTSLATQTPHDTKKIANNVYGTLENAIFDPQSLPEGISALPWPALQQAVINCRACKLCEGRKNTVFGVGQPAAGDNPPHVDWLIVGEAPDENEDRAGEPFVGQTGQLLDNMLKAMGLARHSNVYIANVIKCRPPGNRNPEPSEVAQCEPYLRRQIELLQPKIILAMGRSAVNSLLQASLPDVHKQPLGKLRGQVHHYASAGRSVPVIVTYHPAYLLRNLPEKARAWADLCLAMEVVAADASTPAQGTGQ